MIIDRHTITIIKTSFQYLIFNDLTPIVNTGRQRLRATQLGIPRTFLRQGIVQSLIRRNILTIYGCPNSARGVAISATQSES